MSKFEMLCSLLPAEINWGDPITPQMVEEIVATEREACAVLVEGWPTYDIESMAEAAKAIRERSNVAVSGTAKRSFDGSA